MLGNDTIEACTFGVGLHPCNPGVSEPVRVSTEQTFGTISAGSGQTCGLTESGAVYWWDHGNVPAAVPGGLTFRTIDVNGPDTVCGITDGGVS